MLIFARGMIYRDPRQSGRCNDMCFHISLSKDRRAIEKRFDASFLDPIFERIFHVSAFSFPKLPVISNDDPSKIQLFTWGFIPLWVKDEGAALKIREQTLNAKAETVTLKPSFDTRSRRNDALSLPMGFTIGSTSRIIPFPITST